MSNVVKYEFKDRLYSFNLEGWFNATEAAKRFNQEVSEWLRLPSTVRYLEALGKALGSKPGFSRFDLVRAQRGGRSPGTWLHPKLAVPFARWLDDDFSVWCDLQIDAIIRNGIRAESNAYLLPLLLLDQAAPWEIRFKPAYYHSLARITGTAYTGHAGGTPTIYANITDRWVYGCLLPEDVYAELKARRGASEKMHQWLTDGGRELLDSQIATVQNMANSSTDYRDFEARMMVISERRGQLGFVFPKAA